MPDLAGLAWPVVEPPADGVLPRARLDVDIDFLRTAIRARPDADTANWLVWQFLGRFDMEPCAGMLRLRLPWADVTTLVDAGVTVERVTEIAAAPGVHVDLVATALASWAREGCHPHASHLRLLHARGLERYRPAGAALDDPELRAQSLAGAPSRTELAVMLAVAGTRPAVQEGLARGARTAEELVDMLEER